MEGIKPASEIIVGRRAISPCIIEGKPFQGEDGAGIGAGEKLGKSASAQPKSSAFLAVGGAKEGTEEEEGEKDSESLG